MTTTADIRAERERVCSAYEAGGPLPWFEYSEEEDALWTQIFGVLAGKHEQFGCARYLSAARLVQLPTEHIPQLREVSESLWSLTRFRLAPAIGSLSGPQFYNPMADGILHATPFIRPAAQKDFSPEPDIIHEIVGHAVMLADPDFAELYRRFGRAASATRSDQLRTALARLFWFTMEVGAVMEEGRLRVCGAALLSSASAMESLADGDLREFRIDDILASEIDDGVHRPALFVAESIDAMLAEVRHFLEGVVD
ncbi:aromatic amino acid hydroxylase [Gordonia aichiensis]|uniref:Putative aromatic amino acid hydroxylase n=1 Tax=Gordonia aichiensis NBRC 108223 TaxID=1220583 RepID=L7KNG9_9ACTN|nr:aromatic amino acid hydroxylase [Gordonia aichiensis]GAC50031.1 putative aromatic amino acid hydroxylase [Gordonia aichiensis NBRC 108223]